MQYGNAQSGGAAHSAAAERIAVADASPALYSIEPSAVRELPPSTTIIRRVAEIKVNAGEVAAIGGGATRRLALPVFDRVLSASIDRVTPDPDGFTAVGTLEGVEHGAVYLVSRRDVLVGAIHAGTIGQFDIRPAPGGAVLRQFDLAADIAGYCGSANVHDLVPSLRGPSCPNAGSVLAGYTADDGNTVDILAVYTPAARDAAGGVTAIEAAIDLSATIANQIYANSGLSVRARFVRKQLIQYTESGTYETDLPRLTETADGFLDSVHADRDTWGADIVSLWVATLNAGGAGFSLFALGSDDDGRYGFQVMRQDNAGFETLAHELGHNFGCQHDRQTSFPGGFFNYSYGYREPGSVWKTVMAYPPGTNIPYFSSPIRTYTGPLGNPGPMGVPGNDINTSCDNTLTHVNTAFTVTNYRPSVLAAPPVSRLYVRAAAPGGGNGASWATAYNRLQDAMGIAVRSRGVVAEIWVASGTYKPDGGSGDRLRSFRLINGVSIYGGFAGTETLLSQRNPTVNVTTLSGDIGIAGNRSDDSYHVVTGANLAASAVLDGFTVTRGNADQPWPHDGGGGIRNPCGSPTIVNCRFIDNRGTYGGAAHHEFGGTTHYIGCTFDANQAVNSGGATNDYGSTPIYENCTFSNNSAPDHGAMNVAGSAAITLSNCVFSGNSANWGGAIGVYGASATLTGCTFSNNSSLNGGGGLIAGGGSVVNAGACQFNTNTAVFGGGVYTHSGGLLTLTNCSFDHNSAAPGGAIHTYGANPTISRCTFTQNSAGSGGSGGGGAISMYAGSLPDISYCTFDGNSAGCCGGAVYASQSDPTIRRCVFVANAANFGAGAWFDATAGSLVRDSAFYRNVANFYGGAVHCTNAAAPKLVNCVFTGNTGYIGGVAWNVSGSHPSWINCSMAGNSAGWLTGGINDDTSNSSVLNSILWQNSDSTGASQDVQYGGVNNVPVIRFSIVQGWTGSLGGVGNNGSNPLFVDANGADNVFGTSDDNLRLSLGSPAIDSGENASVPAGITSDYDANKRFYDHPGTPNGGAGTPPIVDRGAFEFGAACPGDLNFDRVVSEADLGILLGAWQTSDAGDLNGDGVTSEADLGILLGFWHVSCP